MSECFLDDVWRLYYHHPDDADWTTASYRPLATIGTANEFGGMQGAIGERVRDGMFFLMREHVFPCWDDPCNKDGGSLSFRVSRDLAERFWTEASRALLTEGVLLGGDPDKRVNGISISPKGGNCVVKIWLARSCGDAARESAGMLLPEFRGTAMYLSHMSSISAYSKTSR
jgi:hypothetical protein